MSSSFISTQSLNSSIRLSVLQSQERLIEAQTEVATGRYADVGRTLGYKTGQSVSLRLELTRLSTIVDTNAIVNTRLETSQAALKGIIDSAQDFLGQLFGSRDSVSGASVLQRVAQSGLTTVSDLLNTAIDGEQVFAGASVDVTPLKGYYDTPPPASKQAVDTAFLAAFGVTQSDPAVGSISKAAIETFLDGAFADIFTEASWKADWSSASDQPVTSRISSRELIDTSVTANEEPFRQLISAYTAVANLGTERLDQSAFAAIVDKAVKIVADAIQGISQLQARLGTAQERIVQANERISLSKDILTGQITQFEAVDPYEASTRVSTLTTQLETAYTLTSRLQNLSLLNYL